MQQIVIKETESKKTGRIYRAVWLSEDGHKDRLLTLDWFKFACVFNLFDFIKKGEYPVVVCEVNNG